MQFSNTLIALVAAGVVSAQGIPPVPSCSLNCFTDALTSDGCSGLTDFECHCGKPNLVDDVQPCVKKACGEEEQSSVSDVVVSVCKEAGKPIDVPPVGGGDGGDSTTAAEEPSTTAEEPSEPTEEPTETSEPTDEYPTEAPPSSSASPTPSESPSETPSETPSESPSAPTFTGAASKNNIGGVAAIAMAAAYYL